MILLLQKAQDHFAGCLSRFDALAGADRQRGVTGAESSYFDRADHLTQPLLQMG